MKNPHFWEGLEAYSLLSGLRQKAGGPIAQLILWRAAHHILPGGCGGGGSVVEYYFPE